MRVWYMLQTSILIFVKSPLGSVLSPSKGAGSWNHSGTYMIVSVHPSDAIPQKWLVGISSLHQCPYNPGMMPVFFKKFNIVCYNRHNRHFNRCTFSYPLTGRICSSKPFSCKMCHWNNMKCIAATISYWLGRL